MSDAGLNYGRLLQQRQTQSVADYAAEPSIDQGPDVEGQAFKSMPSAGAGGDKKKPSVGSAAVAGAKAGAKSVGEILHTGFMHTWNAVTSLADSAPGGPEPDAVLSSTGQIILGGLTIMMAIPGAIGPTIRGAIGTYYPGIDKVNMLPGEVAGGIRAWFGLPSLLGDPELRKAFVGDPSKTPEERMAIRKALMDDINKSMTAGEFLDLTASLAAPGLLLKGIKFSKGKLSPIAETPTPEPLNVKAAASSARPKSGLRDLTPEDAASHLEKVGNDLHGTEPTNVAPGATSAPTEAPAGAVPPKAAPAPKIGEAEGIPGGVQVGDKMTTPEGMTVRITRVKELKETMDEAFKVGEAAILEELSNATDPRIQELAKGVKAKSEPGDLVAQVEKEMPNASAAEKEARINELTGVPKTGEKPAPVEFQGLQEVLKKGGQDQPPLELWGLTEDVPGHPKGSTLTRKTLEDLGYTVPEAPTPGGPKPVEPLAKKSRGKRPKLPTMPDVPKETGGLGGELGSVEVGLLTRMFIGAAIGGTQGDTPEERVAYAAIGMFGAGFGGRIAKSVMAKLRENPKISAMIDDPTNPKIPVQDAVDPIKQTTRVADVLSTEKKQAIDQLMKNDPTDPITTDGLQMAKRGEMDLWAHIKDLSDRIVAGEEVPAGDLTQAMAFARILHDSFTGRRVGATGAKGLEKVKVHYREINKLAREWSPETTDMQLATALQGVSTIEEVGLLTRLNYAIPEALTQALYGTTLGVKSVVKNGIGNALMVPIGILDRSLASLNVLRPDRPGLLEAPAAFIAIWESAANQFRMMRESGGLRAAWAALDEQSARLGMTHVEVTPRGFEAIADIISESGAPNIAKGFEYLGNIFDLGPGAMRRTDGIAKTINGDMMLQWESIQKASKEGLSPYGEGAGAFWDRVRDIKDDYSQLDPSALVNVKKFRDRQTFTTPFESTLMRAIQAGPNDPWLNLAYRLSVAQFVRTPVRLMEVGAEYTPGINALSSTARTEWFQGGVSRSVVEARLASGGLMIGAFTYLSMQGLITGNLPAYPENKSIEHAGRPPVSVWDPLVQRYRSYAGIEPLTTIVSTSADIAYLVGRLPEKDAIHLLTAYQLAVANNIGLQRFTQAIGEFIDATKQGRTDAQWDQSVKFIREHLGGFKPGFAQNDQETLRLMKTGKYDDSKSPLGPVWRELQALVDDYKRGLGFKQGADPSKAPFVKADRNMFTGDILINDSFPYNPFTTKPAQGDPWAQEVRRLNGAGLEKLPEWIGTQAPADIGMSATQTAPGVRLQPKELDDLEVLMTQVVKNSKGEKLTEAMDSLVTSERYLAQSDVGKKEWLHGLWTEYRQRAETALLIKHPQLKSEYEAKVGAHSIERLSPEKQPALQERLRQRIDRNQLRISP